jgi:hypothetical protein
MTETSIIKFKRKCFFCSRRKCLLSECKYCKESYCFNCLQQEVHECKHLDKMIKDKQMLLKSKLESERCIKRKIECI